ncbi:tRNA (adenosine(37)-N6)-threonylcarbamoyltransferase complex dimerization subunit type 1 TsaB [Alloscardovia criceti]|uniref:tRNA (adenosine(37)-N6)-threonylcarbamoyltransferase complex dimerization subunit type 1 TsaB n=1 Tax=Alloscardovia criceti TaxID=356828 RepID=UPI00036D4ABC|nr:tRNA (adenosine(37)-N6)-threonylcarbamoyltransferase complex dimerization subunit type 1 TsaB [Alloscardovia criceti]
MTYIDVAHMVQALHLGFDIDAITHLYSEPTLVIDTSFGATVGVIGHSPLYEADSRSHVELLQPHIAQVIDEAGLQPQDIQRIVVGTGPAPFTGLRAGIVAARALAFSTGAELLGMNVLEVQSNWNRLEQANMSQFEQPVGTIIARHITLAVNDARRKQLYYAAYDEAGNELLPMNIAAATDIAQELRTVCDKRGWLDPDVHVVVDIIGRGAHKYASAWDMLPVGEIREESVLHNAGPAGLAIFAASALAHQAKGDDVSTDPLYLRRPDVTIPAPNKHVLGQTSISMKVGEGVEH